ncbi:hypothetical protein [Streptomyces sp. NPDC003299]
MDDPVIALLERRGIPYVTLGRDPSRPEFTDWATEDDASFQRVHDHFAASGARSASGSEHTRHSRPAISAVELHAADTTLALLDLLQARIAGEPSAGPILTTARFRIRASSRRTEPHP